MKYVFCFSFLLIFTYYCFAQKPLIDSNVYDKWSRVRYPSLSNDGSYASYIIFDPISKGSTLVIQSTSSNWKMVVADVSSNKFSLDSRMTVFIKSKDTLGIINLRTASVKYIPNVSSFSLSDGNPNQWLAYKVKSPEAELVLYNVLTEKQDKFVGVLNYLFSKDGKLLLLVNDSKKEGSIRQSINLIDLITNKYTCIWEGTKANNFIFDESSIQLAFTEEENDNTRSGNTFWYYRVGTKKAIAVATDRSAGVDNNLCLDKIISFNKDATRLFVRLKEKSMTNPQTGGVQVDIWRYSDAKLQSEQLNELTLNNYISVINISDQKIVRLQQEFDQVRSDLNNKFILMYNYEGNANERNWNLKARPSLYLVSAQDGSRKLLNIRVDWRSAFSYQLSPKGKYLIYYNPTENKYFSYDVLSNLVRDISKEIRVSWTDQYDEMPKSSYFTVPIAGWIKDDAGAIIYGRNDIWVLDPIGQRPAVNLTNGYGSRHNIVFRLALEEYSQNPLDTNQKVILNAFNRENKENGFYKKALNTRGDPQLLTMGPYIYCILDHATFLPIYPKKALNAETYVLRRESASEFPNYFITNDFKVFTPISNLQPQRKYNWLTSQLMTWKTSDGSLSQGVLYKPENFDPKRKYPVIFLYYEKLSNELNLFRYPIAAWGRIDIPWYVSNGYLVFMPDIHYKIGQPGESVMNSVISAAKYLSSIAWVNKKKMGIQGHSFGGYETNYLITHTNIFAAACSGAGVSDLISVYGSLGGTGISDEFFCELDQERIGTTLWRRPDLYIKNSPIFFVNNVTIPLLMMNNKADGAVPFSQGVEFFTALRRLGKKVWMLQYDEGGHIVDGRSASDFSLRVSQFFNYYLKDYPPPKWMTEGVRASMKGIDNGLELDTSGRLP